MVKVQEPSTSVIKSVPESLAGHYIGMGWKVVDEYQVQKHSSSKRYDE